MERKVDIFDRMAYSAARLYQHLTGIKVDSKSLHERFLKSYRKDGKGRVLEIPRISGKEEKTILKEYVKKGKPVIITDVASHWDCVKKWSPQYFKDAFGDDDILISDNLANTETSDYFNVQYAKLREIIECMEKGDNSKYARFNNLLYIHPELIDDVDSEWLGKMKGIPTRRGLFQIFIGAKGTKTSLHAACAHNYFTQVYGVKRWRLISSSDDPALKPVINGSPFFVSTFDPEFPSYEEHPAAEYLDIYESDLKAGEILFVPSSFWHHVVNETDSIGFGYRWSWFDAFKLNFTHVMMLFTARNPSLFYVMKNQKDYSKIFEYISKKKKKNLS